MKATPVELRQWLSLRILDSANIADMDWAIWAFVAVMLGLYVWSHLTAGHKISKKLQPLVDELFGVTPSERETQDGPSARN